MLGVGRERALVDARLHRGEGRYIPDHRQGAEFWMNGKGDPPLDDELIDGRLLSGLDPGFWDPIGTRLCDDLRIMGIQKDPHLGLVERLLIGDGGCLTDAIGIVEDDAVEADPAHAGLRADCGQPRFPARITGGALLGLTRFPVVEYLLVGTARYAHAPAPALVLVDKHDPVLFALVHRARGTGGHTGGIQAMITDPGQVHLEGLLELSIDLLLDVLEV